MKTSDEIVAFAKWLLYVWAFTVGAIGVVFVAGMPLWLIMYMLYWALV